MQFPARGDNFTTLGPVVDRAPNHRTPHSYQSEINRLRLDLQRLRAELETLKGTK